MMNAQVTGLPGMKRALEELPKSVRGRINRNAMSAAGGVYRNEARKHAPKESGLLTKSLSVKLTRTRSKEQMVLVGPKAQKVAFRRTAKGRLSRVSSKRLSKGGGIAVVRGKRVSVQYRNPARYAHLVEKGTKSHAVTASSAKALASSSGVIYGRSVRVRARSHPFLATAVRQGSTAALARYRDKAHDGIVKEAARLAAKEGK